MATFKTDQYSGRMPVQVRNGGEAYLKVITYTPAANMANGDVLALCKLEAGEQVVDFQVGNTTTGMTGSLGVLNAGLTALTSTWKAGIAAYQRADSAASWSDTSARAVGWVASAAQTGAGTLTFILTCRKI